MEMVELLVRIPEEYYKAIMKIPVNQSTADMLIIKNGTVLPKGHGRLVDADAFERRCMFDSNIEDMQDVIYVLRDYKPIIEADKDGEDGR